LEKINESTEVFRKKAILTSVTDEALWKHVEHFMDPAHQQAYQEHNTALKKEFNLTVKSPEEKSNSLCDFIEKLGGG